MNPKSFWLTTCVLSLLFLSGCSSTLIVEGKFPEPLVDTVPINVGIYYPPAFSDWQYEESSEERPKWIILMGQAQQEMFTNVLPGIFDSVTILTSLPEAGTPAPVDIVMQPMTEEFQYTMPSETQVDVYEVWLKYNIQVFHPNGDILADWILTAYGKTPQGFIQSYESGLNQAIVVALRDAGANLALNFKRVPEIRDWLESRSPSTISESDGDQLENRQSE